MKKILLSCVGKSDPQNKADGDLINGPLLTTLEEKSFDVVGLLWAMDVDMNRRSSETARFILDMPNAPKVELQGFDSFKDPTDYYYLRDGMASCCLKLMDKYPISDWEYSFQISGGTPQMQWVWISFIYTGFIPAKLFAVRRRTLAEVKRPYAYEIDIKRDLGDLSEKRITMMQDEINELKHQLAAFKISSGSYVTHSIDVIPTNFDLDEYLLTEKRRYYLAALNKYPDNMADAARILGITPHAYRKYLKTFLETD